jgi:hypothetical protein
LAGIAALGVLSLVHWGRRSKYDGPEIMMYLMGVMPNVAATIAIPFVLLSIWADQRPGASYADVRRAFVGLTLAAGVALIAWEFIQQSSRTLVFDLNDMVATLIGLAVVWMLFDVLTPKRSSDSR